MRLIDADKFEAVLICGTEGHEDTFDDGICYMLNKIDEAPTVDSVPVKDYEELRNELCLRCGEYTEAHNGACDGCRWRAE